MWPDALENRVAEDDGVIQRGAAAILSGMLKAAQSGGYRTPTGASLDIRQPERVPVVRCVLEYQKIQKFQSVISVISVRSEGSIDLWARLWMPRSSCHNSPVILAESTVLVFKPSGKRKKYSLVIERSWFLLD